MTYFQFRFINLTMVKNIVNFCPVFNDIIRINCPVYLKYKSIFYNSFNRCIKPDRIADYIHRHIALSGNDFQSCFLYGIRKKKLSLYSDVIFIICLFFLLCGRVNH